MTILRLDGVSKSFQGQSILEAVGFSLEEGEILCLLGPSGSGKTTLLKAVAGLEAPDQGKVLFEGKNMEGVPPHLRRFGMMFQEHALFPHRNVFANVAFGLEMRKLPKEEVRRQVLQALRLVGLEGFQDRKVGSLSGGERQRVALARSLAPRPRLLMLDEPLGSLDRALRERLAAEIRAILKDLNMTAVFVTHDQAEAFTVGDRIAVLNGGRLEQMDTPEDLYRRPRNVAVARFLGFRNLLPGRLDEKGRVETEIGPLERSIETWTAPGIAGGDTAAVPLDEDACPGRHRPGETGTLLIRPEGARILRTGNAWAEGPRGVVRGLPWPAGGRIGSPGSQAKGKGPGSPETGAVVRGTVVDRRFQGRTYRLEVKVENRRLVFDLDNDRPPPEPGETVVLALNPRAMVWLSEADRSERMEEASRP